MIFELGRKVNPALQPLVFRLELYPHISSVLWVGRVLGLGHMCLSLKGFVEGGLFPAQSRPVRSGFPLPLCGLGFRILLVGMGLYSPPSRWLGACPVRD